MFYKYIFTDPQYFIYWATIILFSVCFHEFCHAYMAYLQGDDTGKREGFFTINPMIQMGAVSLIMLLLTGICWGACPVNKAKFKKNYSDALVSFAGPLGNVILSIVFGFLSIIFYEIFGSTVFGYNMYKLFWMGCYANVALSIFNLIPIPPLDGNCVFRYLYPKAEEFYKQIGNGGFIILFILLSIPVFNNLFWGFSRSACDNIINMFYITGGFIKHLV